MKALLFYFLFVCSSAFALTLDDLTENFNPPAGNISIDHILKIENALFELNHAYILDELITKFHLEKIEDLAEFIIFENANFSTSGLTKILANKKMSSIKYSVDIFSENWGQDFLEKLEAAYRYNHVKDYSSILVVEWIDLPTIHIKTNRPFFRILKTFIHEAYHGLHISEEKIKFQDFLDIEEYLARLTLKEGGEFYAFCAAAKIHKEMEAIGLNEPEKFISICNDINDEAEEKGVSIILDLYGYRERFLSELRKKELNLLNNKKNDESFIYEMKELYIENVEIFESNIRVAHHNIALFEETHNKKKLEIWKENLILYEENLIFYNNLLNYVESDLEKLESGIAAQEHTVKIIEDKLNIN